ncbi:uncharacterized protein [Littorina saxatilis]|uniref:uncharacterized protein n=1 Tax=Littorina saxatilis TaxID=31220 RepID=UPI0038B44155
MAKHFAGERAVSCRVTLFLCVLLALTACARPAEQCAHLNFPTSSSNKIIRAAEGSTLTLPFNLDISNCPRSSNQSVYVYVSTPRRQDFCAVRLTPEGCKSTSNNKCLCVDDTSAEKGAVLTKTVTKADGGPWVWRTGDGSVATEIRLKVQKPSDLPVATVARSSEKDSRKEDGLTTAVATDGLVHQPVIQETPSATPVAPREPDATTEEDIRLSQDRNDGAEEVQHHNILISGKSIGKGDNHAGGLADNLGGVISIVIVVAIVIVGVIIVVVFRKRRAQKEGKYVLNVPPMHVDVSGDDIMLRQRQEPQNDAVNSYVPLCPIRHSGEETPEAFINDAYLATLPRQQSNNESEMLA